MEQESVTTTSEQATVADNSGSESNLADEISKALSEPEETTEAQEEPAEEPAEGQKDNTNDVACPDKFKNKDGSPNVQNILKSYKEIEPLVQEKASWEKERAELLEAKKKLDEINQMNEKHAQEQGFNSAADMQDMYQIVNLEANEYAKYLQYVDDPEEVRNMLIQYMNNPSEDLMEQIELEFAPEINKRVAIASDRLKQSLIANRQKNQETQKYVNIENVISQTVDNNGEIFKYEPFKNLFVNTLHRFGDNFTYEDAQALIQSVNDLKTAFRTEFEKEHGITSQNNKAIDNIASINNNSAPAARQYSNADIDNMSAKELAKEIKKYI